MSEFEWEDTLDDGTKVIVHATEYESGDWSVGLGENCMIYATNGDEILVDGVITNEVKISEKEELRFMEIGLDMFHREEREWDGD